MSSLARAEDRAKPAPEEANIVVCWQSELQQGVEFWATGVRIPRNRNRVASVVSLAEELMRYLRFLVTIPRWKATAVTIISCWSGYFS